MDPTTGTQQVLGIYLADNNLAPEQQQLIHTLSLPILDQPPETLNSGQFVLILNSERLSLAFTGRQQPKPIAVDFMGGAANHRRLYGGGKGQMIARAVGIKGSYRPDVVDLTAGMGQDGFALATLGCRVTLVERNLWIYHLLNNGINRANCAEDQQLRDICKRLTLRHGEGKSFLSSLSQPADVIYLDPMFPESGKTAKVKKSMQAFQQLLDGDTDADELLAAALAKAHFRVVVKRPRKAPDIKTQFSSFGLPQPSLAIEGKSSRFDIYTLNKMPV